MAKCFDYLMNRSLADTMQKKKKNHFAACVGCTYWSSVLLPAIRGTNCGWKRPGVDYAIYSLLASSVTGAHDSSLRIDHTPTSATVYDS